MPLPVIATGPRVGGTQTGRARNSTANNNSRGLPSTRMPVAPRGQTVPTALQTPQEAVATAQQLQALRYQYLTTIAGNNFTKRGQVAAARTAMAGIVANRNAGIAGQENAAAGAGRLGGSYDLGQRSSLVAGAAQQTAAQVEAIGQAKQGALIANMGADANYQTGLANTAASVAAQQAAAQAAALQAGTFDVNSAAYKAIFAAVKARFAARALDRGVQQRNGLQTYASGYAQPTYTAGMQTGAFPT